MKKSKYSCLCSCPKFSRKCGLPQCYFASLSSWVCLILLLFFLSFPSDGHAKTLHGRVIKVFDGDTLLVKVQGREEKVRLREIDAPEISTRKQKGQEPWGKKAKEFVLSKVRNKTVRLEIEEGQERDDYQRLLAYVFVGDFFVNREMIRSGYAFFYAGTFQGNYYEGLKKAEREGREKGSGVWNRKNGLQERPWEFRRRTKKQEAPFSRKMSRLREKEETLPCQTKFPEICPQIFLAQRRKGVEIFESRRIRPSLYPEDGKFSRRGRAKSADQENLYQKVALVSAKGKKPS